MCERERESECERESEGEREREIERERDIERKRKRKSEKEREKDNRFRALELFHLAQALGARLLEQDCLAALLPRWTVDKINPFLNDLSIVP